MKAVGFDSAHGKNRVIKMDEEIPGHTDTVHFFEYYLL